MKTFSIFCFTAITSLSLFAQSPLPTATLGLTLQCAGGTDNRSGLAYNPNQQLYYSVNAGSGSYPIETFNATGIQVFTNSAGFDYRGAWWNPATNSMEGNGFSSLGIWSQALNSSSYAITGGTNLVPSTSGPDVQSCGDLDYNANEILYYHNGYIYRHARATNTLIASVAVTGLPVSTANLNINTIAYTGIGGMEAGLYDFVTKSFYFVNKTTGAYVATCQLPASAPGVNRFKMSFANFSLWLFDTTVDQWKGYQVVSSCGSSSSVKVTACKSYLSPSGKTYTSSGNYKDTLINSVGCDSIISTNLTIKHTVKGDTLHEVACKWYTVPSGKMSYTTSGIYNDTLLTAAGCDSVFPIDLIVKQVNKTVTQTGHELLANNPNGAYQWVDCNNSYAPIPGETNQQFTATVNGIYAVLVTENGCTDTSSCFSVTTVGTETYALANGISFYPNPANKQVSIYLPSLPANQSVVLELFDITGKHVLSKTISRINTELDISNLEKGIYFAMMSTADGIVTKKLIKN